MSKPQKGKGLKPRQRVCTKPILTKREAQELIDRKRRANEAGAWGLQPYMCPTHSNFNKGEVYWHTGHTRRKIAV